MASDRKYGFRQKIWLQTDNMASIVCLKPYCLSEAILSV
jgi:hypothetical protein